LFAAIPAIGKTPLHVNEKNFGFKAHEDDGFAGKHESLIVTIDVVIELMKKFIAGDDMQAEETL